MGLSWAYGVTTVPIRQTDLLPRTLASLAAGGFDRPRLFVDGATPGMAQQYAERFGLEVTARWPTIRTFGNWVLALGELFIRNPNADRYAIFQDDLVTYRNLRSYLEACPYQERSYQNLYLFPPPRQVAPPRIGQTARFYEGWFPSNQRGRSATALVFDRKAVLTLLTHQHMVERPLDAKRGHRKIDGGIVTALVKAGYRELVHNPSLVQHVGLRSSMGNHPFEQAPSFRGEMYDASELLKSDSRIVAI